LKPEESKPEQEEREWKEERKKEKKSDFFAEENSGILLKLYFCRVGMGAL
jgi:hypothetical protein